MIKATLLTAGERCGTRRQRRLRTRESVRASLQAECVRPRGGSSINFRIRSDAKYPERLFLAEVPEVASHRLGVLAQGIPCLGQSFRTEERTGVSSSTRPCRSENSSSRFFCLRIAFSISPLRSIRRRQFTAREGGFDIRQRPPEARLPRIHPFRRGKGGGIDSEHGVAQGRP